MFVLSEKSEKIRPYDIWTKHASNATIWVVDCSDWREWLSLNLFFTSLPAENYHREWSVFLHDGELSVSFTSLTLPCLSSRLMLPGCLISRKNTLLCFPLKIFFSWECCFRGFWFWVVCFSTALWTSSVRYVFLGKSLLLEIGIHPLMFRSCNSFNALWFC